MRKVLLYFILLMAIILAGTVAYVSISGLLTVFSGAGILGLLFFLAIEISKIVATSAIHTYGKKIGWVYNTLLSLGIIIAMGITSMGVYGFLSSGYQKNAAKLDSSNREILLIDNKIKLKQQTRESINSQLIGTQKSISELRSALGNNTQSRVDSKGNVITTTSSANRKAFESQLNIATSTETKLNNDLLLVDSLINVLSESKIGLETKATMSSELGPLKYLADVTGSSMDDVMKWFILLLIVIGDPMAILMIIIFNKIVNDKAVNEGVNDALHKGVNDVVNEGVNSVIVSERFRNDFGNNSETIRNDSENSIQETSETNLSSEPLPIQPMSPPDGTGILSSMDNIEEPKQSVRKITLEDIAEKNRGFSVNVPDRKSNNVVERVNLKKS